VTPEEHKLMITMWAKQYQQLKVVVEILKSRGLLEGDDPMAFATIVHSDAAANKALLQESAELYLQTAKDIGVETGLARST
jgi:hypothetical protein